MLPKYKEFPEELNALEEKINAARAGYESKIKKNMGKHKHHAAFANVSDRFEEMERCFDVLHDKNAPVGDAERAWEDLCGCIEHMNDGMIYAVGINEEEKAELSRDLSDDDFRALWSAASTVADLRHTARAMESKSELSAIEDDLNVYDAEALEYRKQVYSVPEKLNYGSAAEMYRTEQTSAKEEKECARLYDEYKATGEVERLKDEAHKAAVAYAGDLPAFHRGIAEAETFLEEKEREIKEIDDRIEEVRASAEQIDGAAARLNGEREEKLGQIAALDGDLEKNAEAIRQLAESKATIEQGYRDDRAKIESAANASVPFFASKAETARINATKRYARLLLREEEVTGLMKEFNEFYQENGLDKMTPAAFEEKIANGKKWVGTMTPEMLRQYRELHPNMELVADVNLYEKYQSIKDRLTAIGSVTEEDKPIVSDSDVRSPAEIYSILQAATLRIDNSKRHTLERLPEGADVKEITGTVHLMQYSYENLEKKKSMIEYVEKSEREAAAEREELTRRREALQKEADALKERAARETSDAQIAALIGKRNGLVTEKEERTNHLAFLRESFEKARDAKIAASDRAEAAGKKLQSFEDERKAKERIHTKAAADIKTFEKVYEKHGDLKHRNDTLRDRVKITESGRIGTDPFRKARLAIDASVASFRETIQCVKDPKHNNRTHFVAMQEELEKLYGQGNGTSSLQDYKYQMKRVHDAAQAYLDAKNTQIRPIPSKMRSYRLDFAKRLVEFTKQAEERLQEADALIKKEDRHLASSGVGYLPMTHEENEVFHEINRGIETRNEMMKEHALTAQTQKTASVGEAQKNAGVKLD